MVWFPNDTRFCLGTVSRWLELRICGPAVLVTCKRDRLQVVSQKPPRGWVYITFFYMKEYFSYNHSSKAIDNALLHER